MAGHGFLEYIKLKFIASLVRLMLRLRATLKGSPVKDEIALLGKDEREAILIPSRDKGRTIKGWLYHPTGSSGSSSTDKKPVLVNWHGSGFILAGFGYDANFCSKVAQETGLVVIDADYRKAPETPFPGAVHDVEDTLKWVGTQPERFDLSRVAVSGFSAGGNLALVAASTLRGSLDSIQIPAVVAFYPPTNLDIAPEAKTVPKPKMPIPAGMAKIFNDCYLPPSVIRADPRVSPSLADLATYPETVVILTCEGDTLAPEGNELAKKLDDGKRRVVNETLEDTHHGFDKGCLPGTSDWDKREYAYNLVIQTLKNALRL